MMARRVAILFAACLALVWNPPTADAAGDAPKPTAQDWSFHGVFGRYDMAAVRRGFQVYQETCASCHGLNLLAYRNLAAIGFDAARIKEIAAEYEVVDGPDEEGEMFDRPALPSDRFVSPFPNVQAARAANNGAAPPDLSLIAKARPGGPDYLYALLTGFTEAPEGMTMLEGANYNRFFPGHQIAMPPPLADDQVEYADGTKASVDQMARDVTYFLTWASDPSLEARHRIGIQVFLFLLVMTGLLYAIKRRVWSRLH